MTKFCIKGLKRINMRRFNKFFHWLRRRCDEGKNPRWLTVAIFVNWPEPKLDWAQLDHLENIPNKFVKNLKSGVGGDAIASLFQCQVKVKSWCLRWPSGSHISWWTRFFFAEAHLRVERNPYAKFRQNSSSGYEGNSITGKIQACQWLPNLLTDQYQIWACTTRPPGEQPDKFRKYITSGLRGDVITSNCLWKDVWMDIRTTIWKDIWTDGQSPCGLSSTYSSANNESLLFFFCFFFFMKTFGGHMLHVFLQK